MIVALSYVLAVILTVAVAILLYPLAGLFWVFGLLGKLSDNIFYLTKKIIRKIWSDLRNMSGPTIKPENEDFVLIEQAGSLDTWTCVCGHSNTTRFCGGCGAPKPIAK